MAINELHKLLVPCQGSHLFVSLQEGAVQLGGFGDLVQHQPRATAPEGFVHPLQDGAAAGRAAPVLQHFLGEYF